MLDNVIDINYYAVEKARNSNARHRPVGMGIMGFQDCLQMMRVPYASQAAVEFADRSMEAVCYHAYIASSLLAEERGRYQSCCAMSAVAMLKSMNRARSIGIRCARASNNTACATPIA
ncbi:hypothetical protein G6F59_017281 [Rhizopus arrhizus]|nr:hypothetical protein G6F59_017281 [Rhizopus arrhizus]